MLEYKQCIQCKNTYDEFEYNDKACGIDGMMICTKCRVTLGLLYKYDSSDWVRVHQAGKMRNEKPCILCSEVIPRGSIHAQYKKQRGKKLYFHDSCPAYRQERLDI